MAGIIKADDLTKVEQVAATCKQWTIGPGLSGAAMSKATFTDGGDRHLYALASSEAGNTFLQYEEQNWGINLGWTDQADAATQKKVSRWFFARQDGTGQPFNYGETIALAYGTGRSFLKYAERSQGINLDWSSPPVYEWQVLGGTEGTPVQLGHQVAIWNTRVEQFFVHFDRNAGGNIGWSDSPRWGGQLGGWVRDLVKEYGDEAVKAAIVAAV